MLTIVLLLKIAIAFVTKMLLDFFFDDKIFLL